jgi:hypothetical protein
MVAETWPGRMISANQVEKTVQAKLASKPKASSMAGQ